jgi:hypothetical protein
MKKLAAVLAAAMAMLFTAGTAMAAAPDKPIVIKVIQKTKPPVTFEHARHKDVKCQKCHHKDAEGKEQKCFAAKCHGAKAEGKMVELKEAFHQLCRECHKKEKKGQVKCEDCHKK